MSLELTAKRLNVVKILLRWSRRISKIAIIGEQGESFVKRAQFTPEPLFARVETFCFPRMIETTCADCMRQFVDIVLKSITLAVNPTHEAIVEGFSFWFWHL